VVALFSNGFPQFQSGSKRLPQGGRCGDLVPVGQPNRRSGNIEERAMTSDVRKNLRIERGIAAGGKSFPRT